MPTNSVATTGSRAGGRRREVVDPVAVDVAGEDDGVRHAALGEELDEPHPLGGVAGPLVHRIGRIVDSAERSTIAIMTCWARTFQVAVDSRSEALSQPAWASPRMEFPGVRAASLRAEWLSPLG